MAVADPARHLRQAKWTRAVHSQPPTLHRTEADRPATASASIECWRGPVDELRVAATELVQGVAGTKDTQSAQVTWADGLQQAATDVDSLREALKAGQLDNVLAVRFDVSAPDGSASGTLLARAKIPGLAVEVTGADRARIFGITELVFRQTMIGYVDRMGGWRIPVWMLSAAFPVVVVIATLNGLHISYALLIRLPILLLAVIASVVTMALAYEALLVKRPFSLQEAPIPQPARMTADWTRSVYRHPVTRRVLAILGAIILGIVGSELANIIPWPWGH